MDSSIPWAEYSSAYAFMGNSLLAPVSKVGPYGLSAKLWDGFGFVDDRCVAQGIERMLDFLDRNESLGSGELARRCSVEHARLFVGPPKPRVLPWETLARSGGRGPAFGEATIEMRALLAEEGLSVSKASRQAEDHMGIELLYLARLCDRAASGEDVSGRVASFLDQHILSWMEDFKRQVIEAAPDGYYAPLVCIAQALAEQHRASLELRGFGENDSRFM